QLFSARGGQLVVFRAAIVVRSPPASLNPSAALEAVKGGIQRTLLDLQDFAGYLMDSFGNRPAVVGAEGECSQDQEVQRALRKINTLVSHQLPLSFYRDDSIPPVGAQGGPQLTSASARKFATHRFPARELLSAAAAGTCARFHWWPIPERVHNFSPPRENPPCGAKSRRARRATGDSLRGRCWPQAHQSAGAPSAGLAPWPRRRRGSTAQWAKAAIAAACRRGSQSGPSRCLPHGARDSAPPQLPLARRILPALHEAHRSRAVTLRRFAHDSRGCGPAPLAPPGHPRRPHELRAAHRAGASAPAGPSLPGEAAAASRSEPGEPGEWPRHTGRRALGERLGWRRILH